MTPPERELHNATRTALTTPVMHARWPHTATHMILTLITCSKHAQIRNHFKETK